jgi:NAD(P)-dependent dehydrogenase (short-subunit alcohol dehydrogenase family)
MASSLAVEWAKKGVRVNVLSPGYMLTKLTRTILAHDTELKVCRSAYSYIARRRLNALLALAENVGEPDTDGEGTSCSYSSLLQIISQLNALSVRSLDGRAGRLGGTFHASCARDEDSILTIRRARLCSFPATHRAS